MKTILLLLLITTSGWSEAEQAGVPPEPFRRIAELTIPEIDLSSCTINELVEYLSIRIFQLDPNNPTKLSILKVGFPPETVEIKLQDGTTAIKESCPPGYDYKAKDVSVGDVLNATSKIYKVEFHVTDIGLVVTPTGKNPFPNSQAERGKIYYTYNQNKKPNKP